MLPTAACSLQMPHIFLTKLEIGGNSGVEEKWRNKQEMRKDTKKYWSTFGFLNLGATSGTAGVFKMASNLL